MVDSVYLHLIFEDSNETVTSLYAAKHSSIQSPKDAVEVLLKKQKKHSELKTMIKFFDHEITQEDLDTAARYGHFSQRPSDLFLKLYYGAIRALELDPLAGCVSPRLIGTSGVIPLTIISTIPDIMRYFYSAIVHAQKEILFATCWWEKGETAEMMCSALRDLNKRAAQERRKVVVKFMFDHFRPANITHSHAIVPLDKWAHYNIPTTDELPHISLEINTSHRLIMGASHVKFLVVDRKIALLNSNNIYDRPNFEMMVHYEGDVVNAFYDIFIISWSIPFKPDLVCLQDETPAYQDFQFGNDNVTINMMRQSLEHHSSTGENPFSVSATSNKVLQALVENEGSHSPALLAKATSKIAGNIVGCDTSPRSQHPLTSHFDKLSTPTKATTNTQNLSFEQLEKLATDFTPFICHTLHQPIPIAFVNRAAHGTPGRSDKINPQNAAWLSAFRCAEKSIFIQSPNFNATPAIEGVIAACRRGIKVTLWIDLGYNDEREGPGTMQGGTNEHVMKKLYKELKEGGDGAEKNLETFWYTAKDQTHPRNFSEKKRNCHIKFMSIDDHVAIMGSGNMDTQTWFHSEEINTMIDSPLIVRQWMDALYKNQSTNEYGRLDEDGKWHDTALL